MKLSDARVQVCIVGFICLCCPGIFNAMQGLGGAGGSDPGIANAANTALYACFAVFGYFGGPIYNLLGNKILMFAGGLTYAVYAVFVYLAGTFSSVEWLSILGGVILGIGAGIFWTAQGAMMLAYATEANRGTYVSLFWIIFNMGGLIGGILTMGINWNSNEASKANPASYFVFVGFMAVGSISALFLLLHPSKVIKEDGTRPDMKPAGSAIEELKGAFRVVTNRFMLLLTVFCLASNWGYTYQFNYINGFLFTIRARGLNATLYWASEMLGSWCVGRVMDIKSWTKRQRVWVGYAITVVIFGCGIILSFVVRYGFEGHWDKIDGLNPLDPPAELGIPSLRIDVTQSSRYALPGITYPILGVGDAAQITFMYWVMGAAAAGDMKLAANFAGYFKGVQSLGACFAWLLDIKAFKIQYGVQLIVYTCLWVVGMVGMLVAGLLVPEEKEQAEVVHDDKVSYAGEERRNSQGHQRDERTHSEAHGEAV